ncbi:MAG: histone deacetylase [Acidobacteriota bacterium]
MKAFYCDQFELPLPPEHRFPMAKYRLLRQRVAGHREIDLEVPPAAEAVDLLRVHDAAYVSRVVGGALARQEIRRLGFPWSRRLVERSRRSVGGTLAACRWALEDGAAVNLAGGTHHAFADHGEGYCVFNDVAVAARSLLAEGSVRRVLVVDLDVHQGNGTAAIFGGDPRVFTFSMHGRRNFPARKVPGDLDLALEDGTGDDEYLDLLDQALERAFAASGAELVIYVAGADPFAGDRLGRLALSRAGLAERDRRVFAGARREGLPVAAVMAGGYARDVDDVVAIHQVTVETAVRNCTGTAGGAIE